MAGDGEIQTGDIKAHVRTYDSVISLLKWGAVVVFLIAALVIWLIS